MASLPETPIAQVALEYIFHHVALPPKLPQKNDEATESQNAILDLLLDSANSFKRFLPSSDGQLWNQITEALSQARTTHNGIILTQSRVLHSLQSLPTEGCLIFYIAAQNAGLLVRRGDTQRVVFECLEASASNESVMAAQTALRWSFPGLAVSVPLATYQEPTFQLELANMIARLNQQLINDSMQETRKGGTNVQECRDTVDPDHVASLLMPLLEVNGEAVKSDATTKRIRDDVLWRNALLPWRRSPLWLVLRVGLQRQLVHAFDSRKGTELYKVFISFFLARLCKEMRLASFTSAEELAFVRTKLARRLDKIREAETLKPFVGHFTEELQAANTALQQVWSNIQQEGPKYVTRLPTEADSESLNLSLTNSRDYINNILSRTNNEMTMVDFKPNCTPRKQIDCLGLIQMPPVGLSTFDSRLALADIEDWVKAELHTWKSIAEPAEQHCIGISQLLDSYERLALDTYKGSQEQLSVMLLTIFELWVALDELVIRIEPMLAEYGHDMPLHILEPLVLLTFDDLCRVHSIESYLKQRNKGTRLGLPSVFESLSARSFSSRFFEKSWDMQTVYRQIIQQGELAKTEKKMEWEEKQKKHNNLTRDAAGRTCEQITSQIYNKRRREYVSTTTHSGACTKCSLQRKAREIETSFYICEYPLHEPQAKSVVFELRCPQYFTVWRQTTWKIQNDLGRSDWESGGRPMQHMQAYEPLMPHSNTTGGRISLASVPKSFLKSHYSHPAGGFPTLESICVPNALRFNLYDTKENIWVASQVITPTLAHHCQALLPTKSPFSGLQFAVDMSLHTSNETIARQSLCPKELTLHEYNAFQDIRSGHRLTWYTIVRELGSVNLNFSSEAVAILLDHAALQCGPGTGNDPLRETHCVFNEKGFCRKLTELIERKIGTIEENWQELNCMKILVTMLLRLLSLNRTNFLPLEIARLLNRTREITFGWTRKMREELRNCSIAEKTNYWSEQALIAALLCRKTFTLEASEDLDTTLTTDELSCFLECAITVASNTPPDLSKLSIQLQNDLLYDFRVAHNLEKKVRISIQASNDALSHAVNQDWTGTRDFTEWQFLQSPDDRWSQCRILAQGSMCTQRVSFNILDGTLLVDGRPRGRLPNQYTTHPLYRKLLGNRILDIYPSDRGHVYKSATTFHGWEIHFELYGTEHDIVIRAYKDSARLVLLPQSIFHTATGTPDLPLSLITNCAHWLDLDSGDIEIRPEKTVWDTAVENWRVNIVTSQGAREGDRLVDVRSELFHRVSETVEPFESSKNIVVFNAQKHGLTLQLPRFRMEFRVNSNCRLESVELQALIDDNQDIGTLYGLKTKLVLVDAHTNQVRSVAIPRGNIVVAKGLHGHVDVNIETIENSLSYCRYSLNTDLNRLDCHYEPYDLYRKAHLHALTSFVLPDPFTGRTGTEEALAILKSGQASPWNPVDNKAREILSAIAELTPGREFYPPHLRTMQTVRWHTSLSAHSQHDDFLPLASKLICESNLLEQFLPDMPISRGLDLSSDVHLLKRAQVINAIHRQADYVMTPMDFPLDVAFDSRAKWCSGGGVRRVQEIATILKAWSNNIAVISDLKPRFNNARNISGYGQTYEEDSIEKIKTVEFSTHWGAIFTLCLRSNKQQDRYRLMFLFGTIAYGKTFDVDLLRTLAAVAILEEKKTLKVPSKESYVNFHHGEAPKEENIIRDISGHCKSFPDEHKFKTSALTAAQREELFRSETIHELSIVNACQSFAKHLLEQWPCAMPNLVRYNTFAVLNDQLALGVVRLDWLRIYDNHMLSFHLEELENYLATCKPGPQLIAPSKRRIDKAILSQPTRKSLGQLGMTLRSVVTAVDTHRPANHKSFYSAEAVQATPLTVQYVPRLQELAELETIMKPMALASNNIMNQYARDLSASVEAVKDLCRSSTTQNFPTPTSKSFDTAAELATVVNEQFSLLLELIGKHQPRKWLLLGDLWPRITPVTILQTLGTQAEVPLKPSLRGMILQYGLHITALQRARRLEQLLRQNKIVQYHEELANPGHDWPVSDYPDWLLLEIEADLMIRPEQVQVARAMIKPQEDSNTVLQLNMGKGKSSVIIPMIVAVLADSDNCVRVIVPKPLLQQSGNLLASRLGQMLGRRICHVHFSRDTPTNAESIDTYAEIHRRIQSERGIMLALHEHILSFKLIGVERLSNKNFAQSSKLLATQTWLEGKCRDVLDECDHTLAVRTQLIYPLGAQSHVDGAPSRWKTIQKILHLVKDNMHKVIEQFPDHAEVIHRSGGGFPTIFLLNEAVEDYLIDLITDAIINSGGVMLPLHICDTKTTESVKKLIREQKEVDEHYTRVSHAFRTTITPQKDVLLIRGLLAFRILIQALAKRWNVQYGNHPTRCLMAVPFRGKGIHSEHAEFAHVDVAILLTCLTYYYSGLERDQFRKCMEEMQRRVDPSSEYDLWYSSTGTIPESLRSWNAINLEDDAQFQLLFKHMRYTMEVVNFYLNTFVFPKEARHFERKLIKSAWDIPSVRSTLRQECHHLSPLDPLRPTTGFSGTNDGRHLLPLNIKQIDLPGLAQTNAEVLTYLLEERNRSYLHPKNESGQRLTISEFIRDVSKQQPHIQMILDAGAQVLELDNESVAQLWLREQPFAPGVVYFNANDKLMVMRPDGRKESLMASPFAGDLGDCLVYLDESHTRGTDLKLPATARAALTLGPGQTKDITVQAAMRLRQLAYSQSVVFYAPPEVHQSILDLTLKESSATLTSADVVTWLLHQSTSNIEALQPLFIAQGEDFCQRSQAALDFQSCTNQEESRTRYLNVLEQPDAYTIAQMYAPQQSRRALPQTGLSAILNGFLQKLNMVRGSIKEDVLPVQASEEQERELEAEKERETEVQRPTPATALKHVLDPNVVQFAELGYFRSKSLSFRPAFMSLQNLQLVTNLGIRAPHMPSSQLFVTLDFMRTVKLSQTYSADDYVRPVNWVLWSKTHAVVISPYEAQEVLPRIRSMNPPKVYLLLYAAPTVRSMLPFEKLDFSVPSLPQNWQPPPWLVRDLGLFAGRLYFTFEEYKSLIEFLGISWTGTEAQGQFMTVYKDKMLEFLMAWLMIRRKQQDYTSSPMGYVVNSWQLKEDHPFFKK